VKPGEAWVMWQRRAQAARGVAEEAYALGRVDQLEECYPALKRMPKLPAPAVGAASRADELVAAANEMARMARRALRF
jgi:hypothetical protein